MDEIRTASGVSLKRLYQLFPAKDQLVQAYLSGATSLAAAARRSVDREGDPPPASWPSSTVSASGSPSPASGAAPGSTLTGSSAPPSPVARRSPGRTSGLPRTPAAVAEAADLRTNSPTTCSARRRRDGHGRHLRHAGPGGPGPLGRGPAARRPGLIGSAPPARRPLARGRAPTPPGAVWNERAQKSSYACERGGGRGTTRRDSGRRDAGDGRIHRRGRVGGARRVGPRGGRDGGDRRGGNRPRVDRVAERALGHRAADIVGRPVTALLAEGDGAERAANWREQARTRRPWSGVLFLRRRDGSVLRAVVEAQPLIGEGRTDWLVSATDPSGTSAWPPARSPVSAALLARAPIGLSIWDTDLRCVWVNGDGGPPGRLPAPAAPGAADDRGTAGARGQGDRRRDAAGAQDRRAGHRARVPLAGAGRGARSGCFRRPTSASTAADGDPIGVCNMATTSRSPWPPAPASPWARPAAGSARPSTSSGPRRNWPTPPFRCSPTTSRSTSRTPFPSARTRCSGGAASDGSIPASTGAPGSASVHEGCPNRPVQRRRAGVRTAASPLLPRAALGRVAIFEPDSARHLARHLVRGTRAGPSDRETGMHSLIIVPLKARGTILGRPSSSVPRTRRPSPATTCC